MARMGAKVKALARELGVTSRQIIDRCRAEGIFVQNSITRLQPEVERLVRGWFADESRSPDGGEAEAGEPDPAAD